MIVMNMKDMIGMIWRWKEQGPRPLSMTDFAGMVIRTSSLIPEMREAFFKCAVCSHTTTVEINRYVFGQQCDWNDY